MTPLRASAPDFLVIDGLCRYKPGTTVAPAPLEARRGVRMGRVAAFNFLQIKDLSR